MRKIKGETSMKKSILFLTVLCLGMWLVAKDNRQTGDVSKDDWTRTMITKTYELKNVSPNSIRKIIQPYVIEIGSHPGNQIMAVKLFKANEKALEDLISKLDRPKKAICFRIFTLLASNSSVQIDGDMHPDLKEVVAEISQVLGYKQYLLDGVSTLTVNDGSDRNELILNSKIDDLVFFLYDVALGQSEDGKSHVISTGLELREKFGGIILEKDRQVIDRRLLSIDRMQIKEKGYLVAGVSRLDSPGPGKRGQMGDALVLVINATVE
jgi:hypothetical protein